jgi:hypothetical protein
MLSISGLSKLSILDPNIHTRICFSHQACFLYFYSPRSPSSSTFQLIDLLCSAGSLYVPVTPRLYIVVHISIISTSVKCLADICTAARSSTFEI